MVWNALMWIKSIRLGPRGVWMGWLVVVGLVWLVGWLVGLLWLFWLFLKQNFFWNESQLKVFDYILKWRYLLNFGGFFGSFKQTPWRWPPRNLQGEVIHVSCGEPFKVLLGRGGGRCGQKNLDLFTTVRWNPQTSPRVFVPFTPIKAKCR